MKTFFENGFRLVKRIFQILIFAAFPKSAFDIGVKKVRQD